MIYLPVQLDRRSYGVFTLLVFWNLLGMWAQPYFSPPRSVVVGGNRNGFGFCQHLGALSIFPALAIKSSDELVGKCEQHLSFHLKIYLKDVGLGGRRKV
jgi:hypothetical protein